MIYLHDREVQEGEKVKIGIRCKEGILTVWIRVTSVNNGWYAGILENTICVDNITYKGYYKFQDAQILEVAL